MYQAPMSERPMISVRMKGIQCLFCHLVEIPFRLILRDIDSFFLISGGERDSSVALRNDKKENPHTKSIYIPYIPIIAIPI